MVLSGCSSPEPAPEEESTPAASVASPSAPPEVEVDPESAKWICNDLRMRDVYREADDLAPHEEAQIVILEMEANTKALEEDAEPALREIALEHMGDSEAGADAMIPWCQENTEPVGDGIIDGYPW
ncbi:hypothetical protein [Nocardiopsis sp. NRRL B-16309]|uniref:hypothetical protein n=1 Tax=Nocardiopsis sp. NRRL B-16309 TaxID=1519494 RepID=UPI001E57E7D9|nr:hypothetical protein [Nocardiopsis sp. NRRL B-16309]